MGQMIDGLWHDVAPDSKSTSGGFIRSETVFRNWITPDGRPGPTGLGGFAAEPGRYHLYVSLACPWAHRTLILRVLKRLDAMVTLSVVHPFAGASGWTFEPADGVITDPIIGARFLYEIYAKAQADYSGRVTVPVLWDRETRAIVNNESSEIIRMFNSAFDGIGAAPGDTYPEALRQEIDALNARIYETLNNGVYRCGFATTQEAYAEAFGPLFDTLDFLEDRLVSRRYLTGAHINEADWRLFTTLVRFDSVYATHFKTNLRRIVDYRNLWGYLRDLYQTQGIAETVNMTHIKDHYFTSHRSINPSGIVPLGPKLDFMSAAGRERLGG